MSYTEYQKALALGQKEVKACRAKDISPYLPVLDEMLEGEETRGEVPLGLVDLPIELTEQMMRRREAETGTRADIHEQDEAYLRRCRESAGKIADRLGWRRIDCSREGAVRTQEDIHAEAWELVRTLLGR